MKRVDGDAVKGSTAINFVEPNGKTEILEMGSKYKYYGNELLEEALLSNNPDKIDRMPDGLLGKSTQPNTEGLNTWQSWLAKTNGEELTFDEIELQKGIGIGEMIAGGAGVFSGTAVQSGIAVMADGSYLFNEGTAKRKAAPFSFYAKVVNPMMTFGNFIFVSPLP